MVLLYLVYQIFMPLNVLVSKKYANINYTNEVM